MILFIFTRATAAAEVRSARKHAQRKKVRVVGAGRGEHRGRQHPAVLQGPQPDPRPAAAPRPRSDRRRWRGWRLTCSPRGEFPAPADDGALRKMQRSTSPVHCDVCVAGGRTKDVRLAPRCREESTCPALSPPSALTDNDYDARWSDDDERRRVGWGQKFCICKNGKSYNHAYAYCTVSYSRSKRN